jgi:hypothetical protein
MTHTSASPNPGYFHWNFGGWFGSQLGASAWLFAGAFWFFPQEPVVGLVWVACGAAINGVGTLLWLNRGRLRPHLAIQVLHAVTGVCGAMALYAANTVQPNAVRDMGWPGEGYWALLIVPAMMIWFAAMEFGSRRSPQSHG